MNPTLIELWAVAIITILAVVSPGADFAMVTRNSIIYGRAAGLSSSIGIAAGVQLHVLYTMIGVGFLIRSSPDIFLIIKLIGALYLIYIGCQTFISHKTIKNNQNTKKGDSPKNLLFVAFKNGFLTNALNPKTTLFVLSVYTQIVDPKTSITVQLFYGIFMSITHFFWFGLVSIFFSKNEIRNKLLDHQKIVNRSLGFVLILIGLWLAFGAVR